ncbi:MAG: hypothetical protein COB50_00020 [Thiotrichales bacterium]|nr:MAG: hypothetical protein COB50_00020 [Thiotrichales bacterium]
MWDTLLSSVSNPVGKVYFLIMLLNAVLHVCFASGIAKDIHVLHKSKIETRFASGIIWVLGTLVGGVFVVCVYWFIHHSSLARHK